MSWTLGHNHRLVGDDLLGVLERVEHIQIGQRCQARAVGSLGGSGVDGAHPVGVEHIRQAQWCCFSHSRVMSRSPLARLSWPSCVHSSLIQPSFQLPCLVSQPWPVAWSWLAFQPSCPIPYTTVCSWKGIAQSPLLSFSHGILTSSLLFFCASCYHSPNLDGHAVDAVGRSPSAVPVLWLRGVHGHSVDARRASADHSIQAAATKATCFN